MRRKSITFRLTLYFASASTAVLVFVGIWIGSAIEKHFVQQDIAEMSGKLELIHHALANVRTPSDVESLPRRLGDALIGHHGLSVTVIAADGHRVFTTPDAEFPPSLLENAQIDAFATRLKLVKWHSQNHTYRGFAEKTSTGLGDTRPYTVAIALDIAEHQEFISAFQEMLWFATGLGILFAGLLGWIAARRGLAPLHEIAEVARGISANRLTKRLPVDTVPVELVDLATSFNEMLARLEDSFQRLSDFSSDLAHELRTPVSNLTIQTQVALSQSRSADAYREVLYSNLEEFERLARMAGDMLFLAKADNGLVAPNLVKLDLAGEIDELIEFYEALADEQKVTIIRNGSASVQGDQIMLRRAIGNLLSNAIRHAPRDTSVKVEIANADGEGVRIAVENSGSTIPPEHLPRLFDRFYRVDPARQHSSDGAGLGLAIAKSIVEAHGGRITVSSEEGVTRFTLSLP
ncbi:MAG: heavy metal sensor histidine kinase [Betaproteobacteria bacterium]|nr:heavy metal sensor histidine kinase [Betaproteobacteria bacterium]